MPRAFVIMPFSPEFTQIYNLFITETLTELGYEVLRADDLDNSQNILADIIQGIQKNELIVADLTGSNPNVYYELGIAHALQKNVILLTQDIGDLPFDLRSYRVIPYSTDFIKIREARNQLAKLAAGALSGEVIFGNPVSDFQLPETSSVYHYKSHEKAGVLDLVVDFETSIEEMGSVIKSITSLNEDITHTTDLAVQNINRLSGNAKEQRTCVQAFAQNMYAYNSNLNALNSKYAQSLSKYESCSETIFSDPDLFVNQEDIQGLRNMLEVIRVSENQIHGFGEATKNLMATVAATPNIERLFIRARDAMVKELNVLIQNTEKTISIFNRSRALGSMILEAKEI